MIELPKGHLSFSQITLWLTAKETYRKKYYPKIMPEYGQTPEMIFGNHVTESMERNEEWCAFIPRYDTFEFDASFEIEGVPIKAYIDHFDSQLIKFREQKTGRTPWTEGKVLKHLQMDIYSMLLEARFGKVDDECELIWVPARKKVKTVNVMGHEITSESSEIELVGPCEKYPEGYVSFKRYISEKDRYACRELILRVAKEINEDYMAMRHLYN